MNHLDKFLKETLAELKEQKLLRTTDDKVLEDNAISFSSNDYLGLARQTISEVAPSNGLPAGSSGSRLTSGTHKIHQELEEFIADWKGTEAAVFFGSGYLANLGVIAALLDSRDVAYTDAFNHSCILDGIRLSRSRKYIYHHNDTDHLESLMKATRSKSQKAIIVTDTIFSMDGDRANLPGLVELAKKYKASVYVDEGHATGVVGPKGAGLLAELDAQGLIDKKDVAIQMGTFSKAIGREGAYIAGSKDLIDFIKNKARTFMYSTASSPIIAHMVLENLKKISEDNSLREKLWENIDYFKQGLEKLQDKITWSNDGSSIFALFVGDTQRTLEVAEELKQEGLILVPIRKPTVDTPRLRACISAAHNKEDIAKLLNALASKV